MSDQKLSTQMEIIGGSALGFVLETRALEAKLEVMLRLKAAVEAFNAAPWQLETRGQKTWSVVLQALAAAQKEKKDE